tara:strand:- start:585 stop:1001 length:417 start_codon:yes stop_codon:yes gene_type:complete
MSLLKNFAKVVDLKDRQVLFLKTERSEEEIEEDKECAAAPYLLEARFYLLDGTTLSETKLSFQDAEKRDEAFEKVDEELARGFVDNIKWMEDALLSDDEDDDDWDDDDLLEDDEDLDDWDDDLDDPDYFGDDDDDCIH